MLLMGYISPVRKILSIGDTELCLLPSSLLPIWLCFLREEWENNESGVNVYVSEAAQHSFSPD